ncbi:LacI family DNA-binding transcriptional regulator [Clostridium fallax]|uniref:Transcriptional regulator, LacI family n=1 Tax=Clostridium fallax TaxID=1533 RepID=A0A1M4XSC4_9CLOT|nr:LacI family DNA-binding transcriptional regulator [Clostridium fallax]SHE96152.1 transcriptional regulator, LacI family [Clostridium fallax]SQB08070.1 HTH-type transcriptional regulator MalR [Clostridium fallax]
MNIKDIAKISGVGVSTVSRVINNHPDVKDETREKVLKIIKEVNFVPNNGARMLKRNNLKHVGVLLKGVYNPFFAEILKTISSEIEKQGYSMILQHYDNSSDEDIDKVVAFIKEKRLQGVICLGGNFQNLNDDRLINIKKPIVLTSVSTDEGTKLKNISVIGIDNKKAGYEATKYLIEKGHRNLAIILGKSDDWCIGNLRLEGFKKALKDYNIEFDEKSVLLGDFDFNKAYLETLNLLKKNKNITGIFAISDIMAIGAAKAVFRSNMKVGEDISIIGFDGLEMAKFYEPSITSIKQPMDHMAKESVKLLFDLIKGESNHKQVVLPIKLIEGESCKDLNKK